MKAFIVVLSTFCVCRPNSNGVTIQMEPLWQHFCMVPFVFTLFVSGIILAYHKLLLEASSTPILVNCNLIVFALY